MPMISAPAAGSMTTKELAAALDRPWSQLDFLRSLGGVRRQHIGQCRVYEPAEAERLRDVFEVHDLAAGLVDTDRADQLRELWDDFAAGIRALAGESE